MSDPSTLRLDFRHVHRLIDPAEDGVQTWQISLLADDQPVARARATRCQYWKAHNLGERMADEPSLASVAAQQLFDADGQFSPEYESSVDLPGNVLVIDDLHITPPWSDPWIVAALVSSIIDRLTDNQYTVILPRLSDDTEAALLTESAALLSAEPFSSELLFIDTSLAAPEEAAHRVRHHLRSRARYGDGPLDEDWGDEDGEVLTARTRAVLHLALGELAEQAWKEAGTLGELPPQRSAGGLFGSLPRVTWQMEGAWRRQMARAFDDLS
ncbi:hypothetical protein [Streptomyces flaveolus]|uniref:hypothetical protein n=1 Tax=Streptomyces flaveolus TaxID=67297 RepID=UPI0038158411